jgi:hypothetical protein
MLLTQVNPSYVRFCVGVLLIAYATYNLARPPLGPFKIGFSTWLAGMPKDVSDWPSNLPSPSAASHVRGALGHGRPGAPRIAQVVGQAKSRMGSTSLFLVSALRLCCDKCTRTSVSQPPPKHRRSARSRRRPAMPCVGAPSHVWSTVIYPLHPNLS